jgi:hypothetical protein
MIRLLSWLGFHVHEWGKWVTFERKYKVANPDIQGGALFDHAENWQRRDCATCGRRQEVKVCGL